MAVEDHDDRVSIIDWSMQALATAIIRILGPRDLDEIPSLDPILTKIEAEGEEAILVALTCWCDALRKHASLPSSASGTYCVAVIDPRTGRQIPPEGVIPPPILAGLRIFATLLNQQEDTARALYLAAHTAGHGREVMTTVLYQVALGGIGHWPLPLEKNSPGHWRGE